MEDNSSNQHLITTTTTTSTPSISPLTTPPPPPPSSIFEGYRALGLVTNDKPFLIKYGRKDDDLRVVTCVGKHFYTFDSKLALMEASHAHEFDINVMTYNDRFVYTASKTEIFGWKHGHKKLVKVYKFHDNKINHMIVLGEELITVDSESTLSIIHTGRDELISQIPFHNHLFRITVLHHPSTYINKVLLGSQQGSLQLFNISKQKCIYRYEGWNSGVTCIEQSPALDVVAIGLQNGQIHLHNLKTDQTLLSFRQDWGKVVRIAFRTDGQAVMVSTSELGHLAIWDLENRRLLTQMRDIHQGPVTGCAFLMQEPLLITSSSDNSLKMWRFDQSDGKGDLLRQLQGHHLPPNKIDFYSEDSHFIVSASQDSSIRLFSIFTERANKSLGTASLNRKLAKKVGVQNDPLKMESIIDFDFQLAREKDFDNLAAIHQSSSIITTWRVDHCRMGEHKLQHKKHAKSFGVQATCVMVSHCGNFVIAGYNNGDIFKFNIQSGLYRGSFLRGNEDHHKNRTPVVGLNADELCTILVTAQGQALDFWNFKTRSPLSTLEFGKEIIKTRSCNQHNLMAIAFQDNCVCVVDIETRTVIREFATQLAKLNDFTFSHDNKWLICALSNQSILVYDLISAELVDHFLLSTPCTSLSMSKSGEFLATAHQGQKGIFVWANMTLYAPTLVCPLSEDHQPTLLDLPIGRPDERIDQDDLELGETHNDIDDNNVDQTTLDEQNAELVYQSPEQINQRLITLSDVPASRWKNLIHLDVIKKRNQPKKPVEKPENAPFFLPVVAGVQPTLDSTKLDNRQSNENSKIINRLVIFSDFGQLLFDAGQDQSYDTILDHLKQLGPAAIDVEIRSLDALPPAVSSSTMEQSNNFKINEPILIQYFLEALLHRLKSNRDFELVNAYLAVLLKCHTDVIVQNRSYALICDQISSLLDESWDRLKLKFSETLCILNYIRNAVL